MYNLTRNEWIAIVVFTLVIISVNKLVIRDQGSAWPTLAFVSAYTGFAAVHARRWLAGRRRPAVQGADRGAKPQSLASNRSERPRLTDPL